MRSLELWRNGHRPWRRCHACGALGAARYHQNTSYVNEESNWVTLCAHHRQLNDEYWEERWSEYYGDKL